MCNGMHTPRMISHWLGHADSFLVGLSLRSLCSVGLRVRTSIVPSGDYIPIETHRQDIQSVPITEAWCCDLCEFIDVPPMLSFVVFLFCFSSGVRTTRGHVSFFGGLGRYVFCL